MSTSHLTDMADDNDSPRAQDSEQAGPRVKKKRLHGACDPCRKRKIKCNSALEPGGVCSHCQEFKIRCTHDEPRPPKKKEVQEAYVRTLEERLSKMENVLRALHPDTDIETLLDLPPTEVPESSRSVKPVSLKSFPDLKYPTPHLPSTLAPDEANSASAKQEPVDLAEEAQDLCHVELGEHLNKLFIEDKRFFGQASTYMFAQYTMNAKLDASGTQRTEYPLDSKMLRRPLYWEMRSWELAHATSQENSFVYPETDLLFSLVSLYFEKSNIIMPVLHRPTFMRSLNSGLHLREPAFGMTVLLVCAIGSRFTPDVRVLLDDDISDLSSGWKYFTQVPVFRNALFLRSTLYDLQCYTLSIIYLLGTSTAHVAWPLLGLGIRFAQEKGVHRRKGQKHSVEEESAKLVFWCLVCIDRWMSSFLGRPCAMQDEEFDLEYPVECDEEYWETSDPEKAFQQPPGKPCRMSCFILCIKLAEMLGFAHRTLYATKKSKMLIGLIGNEWEPKVVTELDSSMNKWKDSIPHYLRWNPENPDAIFFSQSVALYTSFYHLQIQVHRPFLMKSSAMSRTSLAMCSSAARSTAHVLEAAMSRGVALFSSSHMAGFAAALVLLLAHWVHQQSDSTFDSKAIMELVRKLFLSLRDGERKCHMAGRFVDLMQILGCLSDNPSSSRAKRPRESSIIDPPIPQSQQNYRGALWEQPSFAGGPLQRQIAAAKLEPPALMQAYSVPPNSWDFNGFVTPQMGTQAQQPHTPSRVENTLNHPNIPQKTDSFMHGTNFQPILSGLGAPHLFDPHMQGQISSENTPSSTGSDLSDDLFSMWESAPISFSTYDWDIFLSDAMQPHPPR